ncbi:rhodanese-related sulfurtransferase [Glaciecola petra]|uniref:tRNA uridine(34) hydroxylase n=1 Tax=Glaciecola petra TaxID=3075602 RepID=A0ABU2ZQV1_9ALTE|nr:rhodanese-related sulfurtransferase [Aestuariibacter sp. P117]MDT0594413.1 rhodanese-related sulfurtransferase [Aestuariibacter sp. P117]
MNKFLVCALYKFVSLENYKDLRQPLKIFMEEHSIKGTILLASEGLNGTVSGTQKAINSLLAFLNKDNRIKPISNKFSWHEEQPFYRTKVKLKKEIVTMGVDGLDPRKTVGTYVAPTQWNALISDPEVTVIDTRNEYEIEIGSFENAINPNTGAFREFPEYVAKNLDPNKHKKVAMFCTGGIRCEKSTAYLKENGFEEVYHLQGGILQYLEDVPKEESLWKGECFVFDNRVAVNHDLKKSHYDQCYGCRLPITEADKMSNKYEAGVSCPKCYGTHTDEQLARFREREKQVMLAKQRSQLHVGTEARDLMQQKRLQKADAQRERALQKNKLTK